MQIASRIALCAVGVLALAESARAGSAPAWVERGSVAATSAGGRAFYGVGEASGIRNPALLRQTADNRARAELAKIFETFSASLMKDYAASSGEQQVEQAVKTLSAMSLEGVEVRDRYIAGDGSMFALAVLDLESVAAAVRQAKAQGIVRSDVQPVTLDDMFDRQAQKVEAPRAAVASAAAEPGVEKAPRQAKSDTRTKKGGKPAWLDGEDPRFPLAQQLCAVGYGPARDTAENAAYAALAKVFVVNVTQASEDFMGSYARTGAPTLEVQGSAQLTRTSTQKLFSGVRIPEVWQDRDGTAYALSCLERAKAGKALRDQLAELDGKVKTAIERAEGADGQARLKELSRALDTMLVREAVNNELRIVDVEGIGVASPYAPHDVAAALEQAQEELRIGVVADGPHAADFRTALVDGLTAKGYQVEEAEGDAAGFDVLVSAKVRIEDFGAGSGSAATLHFARGVVLLEVKNVAQGKVIGSFNESRKEGHRSMEEAERRVVRELGKKLAIKLGPKLDDAIKGRRS